VSELTFTIDPKAKFNDAPPKRQSTRDILRLSQTGRVFQSAVPQGPVPLGDLGKANSNLINNEASPISREEQLANVVCPSNAVARAKQSKYKRHLISTTLRLNGTWVASYGRTGTTKARTETDEQAVAETEPYLAEALALADARIGIDDRKTISHIPRQQDQRQIVIRKLYARVAGK
jgi:hypothetical protein